MILIELLKTQCQMTGKSQAIELFMEMSLDLKERNQDSAKALSLDMFFTGHPSLEIYNLYAEAA